MIIPNWPAPLSVKALSLTKHDSFNDLPLHFQNFVLKQIHQSDVITLPSQDPLIGDAVYTSSINMPCIIRTADCLCILLCNQSGTEVAALHGGWRGLAANIIEKTVARFQSLPADLIAWLSPAICPQHYEVDEQVYRAFVDADSSLASCFTPTRSMHWQLNLCEVARKQLQALDVRQIFSSDICTYENADEFYSYRREPSDPGRLYHCVWMV